VCGMPRHERQRRRLRVLKTAHIDDSGSDRLPKYYVLAGHLSDVARWEVFADEWAQCLVNGPKPLEYFKMREAKRLKDQFWKWAPRERDLKVSELVGIIGRRVECQVVCAMSKHDYELILRHRVSPSAMDNPYYFLFINIVEQLIQRETRRQGPSKINFVFDKQLDVEVTARKVYSDIWAFNQTALGRRHGGKPHELMGGLDFADDKDVNPLQAADLLAWTEHRRREYPLEQPLECTTALGLIETIVFEVTPRLMQLTDAITSEILRQKYPMTHPGRARPTSRRGRTG